MNLLRSMGGAVYIFGTRRPRGKKCPKCGTFVAEHQGTRQTPGAADVLAFLPLRDGTLHLALLFWEAKRPDGGEESEAQATFRALCARVPSVHHVTGPYDDLIAYLIAHNLLNRNSVPHYRLPKDLHA